MVINKKGKGSNAERELLHKFWHTEQWAALRVAGSGSMKWPSSDLIAGNGERTLIIECKACGADKEYIQKDQINQLTELARKMGAEPWIGIRFDRQEWFFLAPYELKNTENHYVAVKVLAEVIGRDFHKLIQ